MTHTLANTRTCAEPISASHRIPTLATYVAVWKQRRALATMDDRRLADLGISPAQAAREAARPFWDLP